MTADDPFRLKITSTSASGKRESNRQGKATHKNTSYENPGTIFRER